MSNENEVVTSKCLDQGFSTFSSRGTFETILSIWQNLDTQNSTNMSILRKPFQELAEPLGYAELRLKNTDLHIGMIVIKWLYFRLPFSSFPYLMVSKWPVHFFLICKLFSGQFHQHFTSNFWANFLSTKKFINSN